MKEHFPTPGQPGQESHHRRSQNEERGHRRHQDHVLGHVDRKQDIAEDVKWSQDGEHQQGHAAGERPDPPSPETSAHTGTAPQPVDAPRVQDRCQSQQEHQQRVESPRGPKIMGALRLAGVGCGLVRSQCGRIEHRAEA